MDKKSYEPGDIESLLSPKCDFQVSAGFKDRVMKEAQAVPERRRRLLPWVASVGIAAAVVAVVCLLLPWRDNDMITLDDGIASSGNTSSTESMNGSDTGEVKTENEEIFIAKAADDRVERKSKTAKGVTGKKSTAKQKSAVTAPALLAKVDNPAPTSTKEKAMVAAASEEIHIAEESNVTVVVYRHNAMPLAYGDVPLPMSLEMEYGNSGELVMAGIINPDEMVTPYKSEIYANVETISLRHKNMQLTEEEKLQVRRMEQMSYVSKMRLEVEMAESLIQEVYRSIKM